MTASQYKYINRAATVCFLFLAAVYILFTWYGYPLLTNDSQCFLPAAVEIKNGGGLINPFYNANFIEGNKFLFYPPFFPVFMSLLLPGVGAGALYVSILVVNLSSLFISLLILKELYKKLDNVAEQAFQMNLFSVFWLFANCTFIIPANTRPEMLCRLFLYLIVFLALKRSSFKYFAAGTICALSILTSPVFGIYAGFIILLYFVYEQNVKPLIPFAAGCLVVAAFFFILYPYKISELLQTMQLHSKNVIFQRNEGFSLSAFLTYHVMSYNASFGILLFLTAVAIAVYTFIPTLKGAFAKPVFLGLLSLLLLLVLYFTFKNLPMSYYMYVLSPLLLYFIAAGFFKQSSRLVKRYLLLLVMLVSFSFLRLVGVFAVNLPTAQYPLEKMSGYMEPFKKMEGKKIGLSTALWPFFAGKVTCKPAIYDELRKEDFDYLILQQYTSNKMQPSPIPGYELAEDHFDKHPVTIGGFTVSKYAPLYQYAVYKKK